MNGVLDIVVIETNFPILAAKSDQDSTIINHQTGNLRQTDIVL
jgi:hypothetical protein